MSIPAEGAELGQGIRPADPDLAVIARCNQHHDDDKEVGRKNIEPSERIADAVEQVLEKDIRLLSEYDGQHDKQQDQSARGQSNLRMQIEPEARPVILTGLMPAGLIIVTCRGDDLQPLKCPPFLYRLLFLLLPVPARHLHGLALVGKLFFLFLFSGLSHAFLLF